MRWTKIGELACDWVGFCRMWYQVGRVWRADIEHEKYISDHGPLGPSDEVW